MKKTASPLSFGNRLFETTDKVPLFIIIILLHLFSSYVISEYVLTDQVYYNTYGEQVAMDRVEQQLESQKQWRWLGYLFIPLIITIKIAYTAFCLNIGTLFAGFRIRFKRLFSIALVAEVVLVLAALAKAGYLYFFIDVEVYKDFQYAYPLSLLQFFEPGSIPSWLRYPCQTLNLFEITYWFFLAVGLSQLIKRPYAKSFWLVMSSYGVGLLVWMVFVVFLSINLS
jgi:hypothetical protein